MNPESWTLLLVLDLVVPEGPSPCNVIPQMKGWSDSRAGWCSHGD